MKHFVKLIRWFIKEEKGNALLFASASIVLASMGMYFFTALRHMSIKSKERMAHMYNASIIAQSIDQYIDTYLRMAPYPRNRLLDMNNTPQYTPDELAKIIDINNNDIFSLEELELQDHLVSYNDPTAQRVLQQDLSYDKKATKIKIIFQLNSEDKIEDIHYLVNLAGTTYEKNTPYSSTEPFFYIVSFNDDIDTGDYGNYDLIDNDITLITPKGEQLDTILDNKTVGYEHMVLLPEEDE